MKQQKITALENGSIPAFGADPKDPAFFRSIGVEPSVLDANDAAAQSR